MGESGSNADSSNEGLSAVLVNEKGRNKRKFLSDLPLDIPVDVSTLSLTEFPRYEMLEEKFRNVLDELGSMMERSEYNIDEQEDEEEYEQAEWDDPITCQLEELLSNALYATFCNAMKKIVESGYNEEVAEWAVLNSSVFHGRKDALSNVVDGALALLKKEKDVNTPKHHSVFEGLQSLVDYTLLEMIHVVREVKPTLTITEAMWCLLLSDLNLVNACVPEGGATSGSCEQEASGESPALSESKSETSGTSKSDSNKLDNLKQRDPRAQMFRPETPVAGPAQQLPNNKPVSGESAKESSFSLQESKGATDEKSGSSSKKGPSTNSKRDLLRQKAFQFEKNYKGRLSKGAFKSKVAAWGSMVLDKSLKSQSGSSSVVMKGNYSKLTTPAETNSSPVESPISSNSVKDPVFALPAVNSKSPASTVPDSDSCPNVEINVSDPPKPTNYFSSIPFDEILQKYVPQDDKDETILMLVPHKEALEKELRGWTDWANEKVMQAARKLGKDQGELKMLRQEKEELEKFKKEKQTLQENNIKRLCEMEHALANTKGQIELANCAVRRLEEENSLLKKEMEAATFQARASADKLQDAVVKEQETLKKMQSWEAEKSLVMEKVTNLKRQMAELENRLEKAKDRHNQFKVLFKQEEKEKLKALKRIDSLRGKREEDEARLKVEADSIKQIAQTNKQKCEDNIKNLASMISELRLESDKSKIAALSVGYGPTFPENQIPKITPVFHDNFGAENVKPERECVMCMTDEISVVFLPCAHQILCAQCNVLHEKQGMNDCPSCRTAIEKRVSVNFRVD
ncbi:hypothetical protein DH2020_046149 [Rehmannia glutinosa]|uniref:RING-type domain-containing protein n=1 Tax=Rehmannia glutinosa TaxID=99300 RepID=A0ABR0UC62_REHGL